MFDLCDMLEKQFEPFGDGYVFRAGPPHGGKFVTHAEYERLRARYALLGRLLGWPLVAAMVAVVTMLVFLTEAQDLPSGAPALLVAAFAAGMGAYVMWVIAAPARIVRKGPMVAPPLSRSEARRATSALVSIGSLTIILLGVAAFLLAQLASPDGTVRWWVRTIGSAGVLAVGLFAARQKWRDRKADRAPRERPDGL